MNLKQFQEIKKMQKILFSKDDNYNTTFFKTKDLENESRLND